MKTLKILSVLLMLSFCYVPETNAQSWKELKKALKEAKETIKGKKNEKSEASEQTPSDPNDEITLTVSADGTTKEEAVNSALRSAIEQSYETFVSGNTTILDDELVKDEIVKITSGNIKQYKELSSNVLPNGNTYVTLETTVCISKLVSYAQSKGAETEFAGATFGMNMKIKELNKKNEEIALKNMAQQVEEMFPYAFEYELKIKEPSLIKTSGGGSATNLIYKSSDISEALQYMGITEPLDNFYYSEFIITLKPTEQYKSILQLIFNTITSLALTKEEQNEYENQNIETYYTDIFNFKYSIYPYYKDSLTEELMKLGLGMKAHLRSDPEELFFNLNLKMAKILADFIITDNTGTTSKFEDFAIVWMDNHKCLAPTKGTNLLQFSTIVQGIPEKDDRYNRHASYKKLFFSFYNDEISVLYDKYAKIPFLISKKDIAKYSKFEIKNNYLKE